MGEAVHPSIPQGERRGCAGAELVLLGDVGFDIFWYLRPVVTTMVKIVHPEVSKGEPEGPPI